MWKLWFMQIRKWLRCSKRRVNLLKRKKCNPPVLMALGTYLFCTVKPTYISIIIILLLKYDPILFYSSRNNLCVRSMLDNAIDIYDLLNLNISYLFTFKKPQWQRWLVISSRKTKKNKVNLFNKFLFDSV